MKVIPDSTTCIDCGACEVACKRTWEVPHSGDRIEVITSGEGTAGEGHIAMPCFHCAKAPCIPVCPTDAIVKQENDLVRVNKDKCIGCGYCAMACPFGAPQFPDSKVPEAEEENPRGVGLPGLMDKCTLCEPRLEEGEEPACSTECPTDAVIFGTPSEIASKFREKQAEMPFSAAETSIVFGETG